MLQQVSKLYLFNCPPYPFLPWWITCCSLSLHNQRAESRFSYIEPAGNAQS